MESGAAIACADTLLGAFDVEFSAGTHGRTDEYRLRHSVFVEEREWLAAHPASVRLEHDDYDAYSLSFVLRDPATGEPAACQRLILPDRLPASLTTPFEMLTVGQGALGGLARHAWAEVSRTTVAPAYRWGAQAVAVPAMRAIKHASIALATAAGRTTLFSVSDPRTARLVRRMGVVCHRIGDLVDYHGVRALYRMDMREIADTVPPGLQDRLRQLTDRARSVI